MNGALNKSSSWPSKKISTASFEWDRWPPLTSAAQPKSRQIFLAAQRRSSTDFKSRRVRSAASSRFGVTSVAKDNKAVLNNVTADDFNKRVPLVESMTGSTTNGMADEDLKNPATARMISAEYSIPVFTAPGGNSAKTASICSRTISGRQG